MVAVGGQVMSSTTDNFEVPEEAEAAPPQSEAKPGWVSTMRSAVNPIPRLSGLGVISVVLGIGSILTVLITYLILSGATTFYIDRTILLTLLIVNLGIALVIAPIIVWRVTRLWMARRVGAVGSQLHLRMVILFSVIAVFPAVIVAIFSAVTLTLSLNSLLAEPVPTAIENSKKMANYYLNEQTQNLDAELRTMAIDVTNRLRLVTESPESFADFLGYQINFRRFNAAYITDETGTVLAKVERDRVPAYTVPDGVFWRQAEQGMVAIFTDYSNSQFRALKRLESDKELYLVVSRGSDPKVLEHLAQIEKFDDDYETIASNRAFIELIFALTYIVISLIVLLGAIWLGLRAASNLVQPVQRLMTVAERVSQGDLSARVDVSDEDDDIENLSLTFNRMTQEIGSQRDELISKNEQLDLRRRFTEAVLGGVSAGVVGLDHDGRVTLANRSALKHLGASLESIVDKPLTEIWPEASVILDQAQRNDKQTAQEHLHLTVDGQTKHLNVQVTSDQAEGDDSGYVMTFDDITKLVSAQRTAAWADVARRIAHEIKNPLTPIQLSAERLRRKYGKEVSSDPSVFEQCTDTIVRQVKDIGRMVDEFSSFARMPAPVMRPEEMVDLIKRAVFSQRVANADIDYRLSLPENSVLVDCDGRLIGQALTNILKNAAEAIEAKSVFLRDERQETDFSGAIDITLQADEKTISIMVEDNGCGLPDEQRERLTEPYITTRAKGTGLGLAIVKKILEDHGGQLALGDGDRLPGAMARLIFPRQNKNVNKDHEAENSDAKKNKDAQQALANV